MEDKRISELPLATTPLAGTEEQEIIQGGVNKRVAVSEVGGGGGGTWGSITGTLSSQTDLNIALGLKAPVDSPTFTTAANAPTPAADDNDTSIATTAYVQGELRATRTVTGTGASVQADDNKLIIFNSASPFNFTLDQLTAASKFNYKNIGAGAVTLVNGSGVTLAGVATIGGASGTNYPSGLIDYETATTPRHSTATFDQDLINIAALTPTNDDVIQRKAGVWTNRSMAQLATDLGLTLPSVVVIPFSIVEAGLIYSNMPNSEQYLQGSGVYRRRFDATNFLDVRITVLIGTIGTGANNPRMYPQYTTDLTAATGWTTIGAGTIVSGDAITMLSTGEKASNWISLPGGAKADVLFRVAVNGGDGAGDPAMFNVLMHFRK